MKRYLLKYSLWLLVHIINLPQILVMFICEVISDIGNIAYEIKEIVYKYLLTGAKLVKIYEKNNREILEEKVKKLPYDYTEF